MKRHPNHYRGQTDNNDPTLTDQSSVHSTDINVIVTQFLKTGAQPEGSEGFYADMTQLPDDLRGFIEMGRSITTLQNQLPKELRGMTAQEIFALTDEQLLAKLTPPEKPADKKEDTK
ncbi:MAG: internal scaffolding protein [Arizlama microvirus]|nr:MAG: internal scaffolding protein [Arizlama microvirus]